MRKQVVILGSGGFAREVWAMIDSMNRATDLKKWEVVGWISSESDPPSGYADPILGNDAWAVEHLSRDVELVLGMGNTALRRKLWELYHSVGFLFPSLIDPAARISSRVSLGPGSILTAGCTCTTDIEIGIGALINLHCTIGHDAVIEDFVVLSPGVHVSGGVRIGTGSEVGSGAVILPGLRLGPNSIIGAGAVVTKSLPGHETYVGIPARPVAKLPPEG
ncbi:MAG: acetyltransferase [Bacteroidota bacterium]